MECSIILLTFPKGKVLFSVRCSACMYSHKQWLMSYLEGAAVTCTLSSTGLAQAARHSSGPARSQRGVVLC